MRLLQEVMTTGEARLVPPMSGSGEPDAPGNPTNTLLVLAPMKTDDWSKACWTFDAPIRSPTANRVTVAS